MAMMCRNPFVSSAGHAFGCGQCMACRYNRRRVWMHRIMLEAAQHEHNAFVTLTYDDEHMPANGSLNTSDYRGWLNRLRGRVAPSRFRFFLVGEYGDVTQRPHYHAALFGFKTCEYGQSRYSKVRTRCCYWCELVRDTWGKGNVYLGTLEDDSAGYMAGYVTKKMTSKDDPRLNGRHPEFGRMSLKPGIAYNALWDIADALMKYELDLVLEDVPSQLQHGMKKLPMGRYLRRKLRTMIGNPENAPQSVIDAMAKEMLPLRLAARASPDGSLKKAILEDGKQEYLNMMAKAKLYKGSKSL